MMLCSLRFLLFKIHARMVPIADDLFDLYLQELKQEGLI